MTVLQEPIASTPVNRVGVLFKKLVAAVERGDAATIQDTFSSLIPAFEARPPLFARLAKICDGEVQSGAIADLLERRPDFLFTKVPLVTSAMGLLGPERWRKRLGRDLADRLARGDRPAASFSENDYLRAPRGYLRTDAEVALLSDLKWGGFDRREGELLFPMMDRQADRIVINRQVADLFFAQSRHQDIGRDAWDRQISAACLVDHYVTDSLLMAGHDSLLRHFPGGRMEVLDSLFDATLWGPAYDRIQANAPILFSITHGSFFKAIVASYGQFVPNGIKVVRGEKGEGNDRNIRGSSMEAAMLMVRAMEDGRVVLIASDGPVHQRSTAVSVFGAEFQVAHGTAFVVHETSCATGFLAAERIGDRLAPIWRDGPRREEGERLKAYTARWIEFFVGQIEDILRGPPGSLPLRGPWVSALGSAALRAV